VAETGLGFEPEALSPMEAAEERVLMGLRIDEGVTFAEVSALGLTPQSPVVRELIEAGALDDDAVRLRATRRGRLVLDWVTGRLAAG
jgi:oxygen-independent coproporphyrinogen-3 oxidase